MRKTICLLTCLLLSNLAIANTTVVRIYNSNPQYNMFVNYQSCFRDFHKNETTCLPPINHITIKHGENYGEIKLATYTDYARIISAYEMNDEGSIIAHSDFFNEGECESFESHPATLLANDPNKTIACMRG